jgi:hypothetical protein
MNSSTTKQSHAVGFPVLHVVLEVFCSAPARTLRRAAAWLKSQRARRTGIDDWLFYRVIDHCDLEWRIRELDRRRMRSGGGVGGTRP